PTPAARQPSASPPRSGGECKPRPVRIAAYLCWPMCTDYLRDRLSLSGQKPQWQSRVRSKRQTSVRAACGFNVRRFEARSIGKRRGEGREMQRFVVVGGGVAGHRAAVEL